MRISDWSSDVCSSDLLDRHVGLLLVIDQQAALAQDLVADRTQQVFRLSAAIGSAAIDKNLCAIGHGQRQLRRRTVGRGGEQQLLGGGVIRFRFAYGSTGGQRQRPQQEHAGTKRRGEGQG